VRPVPGRSRPKVLFAGSDTIWTGNGDAGKLHVVTLFFPASFHVITPELAIEEGSLCKTIGPPDTVVKADPPAGVVEGETICL
jgi:hypothetical protein